MPPKQALQRQEIEPRARVWRAEPHQAGLPNYTLEPTRGELSLGIGRKRSSEEYELVETVTNTSQPTRETGTTETEPSPAPRRDPLPPYIPPPAQAVVAAERVGGRRSSQSLPVEQLTVSHREWGIESVKGIVKIGAGCT